MRTLRESLLRALRVPAEPAIPAGDQVLVFRAAPNYFRYKLALWLLGQLGALIGLVFGLVFLARIGVENRAAQIVISGLEAIWWTGYILQLPFSYLLVRLDFELRWYVLSDRSLRIRQGILSIREKTMTFANVQQIAVRQNPLQRLLGIADVQVRTAGGGGASEKGKGGHVGESSHEAWFRGVQNAEEIRRAIRDRVRLHRDAGLGDPDDRASRSDAEMHEAAEAARDLHRELRNLRLALSAAAESSGGTS